MGKTIVYKENRHQTEEETHQFNWLGGATQRVKCLLLLQSFGVDRTRAMTICTTRLAALALTTNEARHLARLLAKDEIDHKSYKITEWTRR